MGFNGFSQVGGEDPLVLQPKHGLDLSQALVRPPGGAESTCLVQDPSVMVACGKGGCAFCISVFLEGSRTG